MLQAIKCLLAVTLFLPTFLFADGEDLKLPELHDLNIREDNYFIFVCN